jgi:MoxR-like ATPase
MSNEMTVEQFRETAESILVELQNVIVGQDALTHSLLVTLLAGGNALLEGVPGLGKTLLVRTLSEILDCSFSRIQFTPDLMPADIVGTMIITAAEDGQRGFRFERARTQSALLEAMQEQRATVAGETHLLPSPFFVLATQNPIEMEGTYPLPEAQLDRFLYKIDVPYPNEDQLVEIARRTTGAAVPKGRIVADGRTLLEMRELARQVPVADQVYRYAARIVGATHPAAPGVPDAVRRSLRVGASPRGVQSMIWAGKVEALLDNRKAVSLEDIRRVAFPALRHRLILNFEAQAEGIPADTIVQAILDATPME